MDRWPDRWCIITVSGLELAKDKSFTIVIEDLQATDDSAEADAHEWEALDTTGY